MNTQNFSIDEARHVRDLNEVKVWRSIQLGEHISVQAICSDMLIAHRIIRDPYTYIYTHDQIVCMTKKVELDLYAINVDIAGTIHDHSWTGVRKSLDEAGYCQCPNEVGPRLAIDYRNQPLHESLWILTEPFIDKFDQPHMFIVGRDRDGCYLTNGICATDGSITNSDMVICCKRDDLVKLNRELVNQLNNDYLEKLKHCLDVQSKKDYSDKLERDLNDLVELGLVDPL